MAKQQSSLGKHYIDGHWISGQGKPLTSTNPTNNQPIWHGNCAKKAEVSAAFEAASHESAIWRNLSLDTRIMYLKQFAKQVQKKSSELCFLISLETGKPYWESKTETDAVIQKIEISINAYQSRTSATQKTTPDNIKHSLHYKPHGVVGVLGAFNFPAHLSNGHIIPALLAGNTVIYKPSEYTPFVAEWMVQCWHESGLPKGVLNLIQGDAETAHALIETPLQAVYFTGSYQTGLAIHQQFSKRPEVLLALEMGGNNPLVIDNELENIPAAVYQTLLSSFLTTGQRCTAARRLIIPDTKTGEIFLEQLLKATKALKIGPPTQTPEPFMGPVIHASQALRIQTAVDHLITLGATPLLKKPIHQEDSGFITPCILDMQSVYNPPDEELFGPIIQLYRYHIFDEALSLANQTKYGLSAGFLGDNPLHYEKFYQTVRAGLINWNRPTTGASSELPFGGVGCSGNHRPSAFFAADYAAYPIASLEKTTLNLPNKPLPGIHLDAA